MVADLSFITASRLQAQRPRFTDSIPAKKKRNFSDHQSVQSRSEAQTADFCEMEI